MKTKASFSGLIIAGTHVYVGLFALLAVASIPSLYADWKRNNPSAGDHIPSDLVDSFKNDWEFQWSQSRETKHPVSQYHRTMSDIFRWQLTGKPEDRTRAVESIESFVLTCSLAQSSGEFGGKNQLAIWHLKQIVKASERAENIVP